MINIKEDAKLSVMNHSCAHLMAQAVKHLYPDALFWVGPVIEEGFYYDIDLNGKTLNEEDLPAIEKEMKKLAKDGKRIVRHEISKEEALEMFKNDPYKIDLISRMDENAQVISCYTQGDFTDLCRGPHVDTVKELKNFKLLKVSGAYWKNDAKNHMLQRIYGVCFDTPEALEAHLKELEEAKERDHRKIGKDLKIFMTSELVGRGLPLWLPNGYTLWRTLQNYITDKEIKYGYSHVHTPDLGSVELYKTSGHWDHYKDDMFPAMEMDNEAYVLRPMNCPHHMVMYKNFLHSYKDLPIRIAEIANDFRYEAAGAVKGIERARSFTQNDSHIFCTPEQIEKEFKGVLDLIMDVYKDFGFKNYKCRLSLRNPEDKEKYFDDDTLALINSGVNPIKFDNLKLAITSDDSRMINDDPTPKIILSASGMCEAGRIRHHLKHNLWREECTILFVGYQAEGTLGRKIIEGASSVNLFGEEVQVNASIEKMQGISGHADKNMLLSWLGSIEQKPKVVFVNHGHDTVCDEFAKSIENELEISALAPYSGDGFELGDVVKQVDIGPRKLYDKKLHKVQRNNTVYDRLYLAGQNLMSVIEASKGCTNKDLSRLTDQIIALCEKYKQDWRWNHGNKHKRNKRKA